MTAFHIVAVNQQLRFRIHPGSVGSTYVLIALISLRLFRSRAYLHQTGKRPYGIVIEHIFEQFVSVTAFRRMTDNRMVVDVAVSVSHRHTVKVQFSTLAFHLHRIIVACESVHQCDAVNHQI